MPPVFRTEQKMRPMKLISPPYGQSNASASSDHEENSSRASSATPPVLPLDKNTNRSRKVSILPYNSGDKNVDFSRQRDPRWLVHVLPPTLLIKETRDGPSNRLSQGILMPLFPTMYAQLIAIAREFNFPSTHGLCLYMHVVDGGIRFVPRISAESWAIFLNNLSEDSVPVQRTSPPISCRIEFDIDTTRALWYDSWVSASQRETSFPSGTAPHHRQESVVTMTGDGDPDMMSVSHQHSTTPIRSRHVPRRLSLMDRATINTITARSGLQVDADNRLFSQNVLRESEVLGKLRQPASTLSRDPLTETEQTALHSGNTPQLANSVYVSVAPKFKLDLDKGALSNRSAGPSSELNPPVSQVPGPSVYLDGRLVSDGLTSTALISSSPQAYDLPPSPPSVSCSSTPDTMTEVYDEISSMTSNGAGCDQSPSYPAVNRPSSPDLMDPGCQSYPVTPSTAIPRNSADFLPSLPASMVDTSEVVQAPFEFKQESEPWKFCWPTFQSYPTNFYPSQRVLSENSGYPFFVIYPLTYPHLDIYPAIAPRSDRCASPDLRQEISLPPSSRLSLSENSGYPFFVIYPLTYPHLDIYPAIAPRSDRCASPDLRQEISLPPSSRLSLSENSGYPFFVIYPLTYPHLDIYPAIAPRSDRCASPDLRQEISLPPSSRLSLSENSGYPFFVIYPSTYPFLDIYPVITPRNEGCVSSDLTQEVVVSRCSSHQFLLRNSGYPLLVIYEPTYPYFNIYPAVAARNDSCSSPNFKKEGATHSEFCLPAFQSLQTNPYPPRQVLPENSGYPFFVIYPPTYPYFDIYPAITPRKDDCVSPNFKQEGAAESVPWKLCWPVFQFHPTKPYPSQRALPENPGYPFLVIYPPTYPHFDIYPAITPRNDSCALTSLNTSRWGLPGHAGYPFFIIYQPVYPHFNIYPAITAWIDTRQQDVVMGSATELVVV